MCRQKKIQQTWEVVEARSKQNGWMVQSGCGTNEIGHQTSRRSQKFGKKAGEFLKAIDPYIVDIKNLAVLPNGEEVSVGNINHKKNAHLYRPNTLEKDPKVFKAWQYDGFSVPLQAKVQVTRNETYHLIMAIADQKDASLDSAIFISGTGINGKKK